MSKSVKSASASAAEKTGRRIVPTKDRTCLLVGGTGYIGTKLADHLLQNRIFDRVILADIQPPTQAPGKGVEFLYCDVRKSLSDQLPDMVIDWIVNLAAVHREPGHKPNEYFDTNIQGARNVCDFANEVKCANQVFVSSISVYGPTPKPVDESAPTYPNTAYGSSKLAAECIYEGWRTAARKRRLIVVRPGVIYGPGDPGNVLRMIRAIRRRTFVLPFGADVSKSYGYVFGLVQSIAFAMACPDASFTYNYVEKETIKMSLLVNEIKDFLGLKYITPRVPMSLLVGAAKALQFTTMKTTGVHPDRVRKVARSTHIVPRALIQQGFEFEFDFRSSLEHWRSIAPEDFG